MNSATGPNAYYNTEKVVDEVSQNRHRELVGGMWDEIGKLQLDFLVTQGLAPSTKLVDIGCGCLRGGVHFIAFLEPGNYYGMDISEELLDAGYDVELKNRGLQAKLPRANLVADGDFQFAKFSAIFDIGFAQSLFSHLPADLIRQCLARLSSRMAPNGRLFGTFFIVPDDHPAGAPCERPHGIETYDHKDPYHYRVAQIERLCEGLPWQPVVLGDWGHPRDQQMVLFRSLA